MINSMTGFAQYEMSDDVATLFCEIKSLNHRYLDIYIRTPEILRSKEHEARDLIQQKINRGKIEVTFKLQPKESFSQLLINQELLKNLAALSEDIKKNFTNSTLNINVTDLLSWEGILQKPEIPAIKLTLIMKKILALTLDELNNTRQKEGQALKLYLKERIQDLQVWLQKIKEKINVSKEQQRSNVHRKFRDMQLELDEAKIAQELIWLLQKMDIDEEISRLHTHTKEILNILEQGGIVGRKLDFYMQELNRETNTIASKSLDTEISQATVEMKVLIEQMREQVQNIE